MGLFSDLFGSRKVPLEAIPGRLAQLASVGVHKFARESEHAEMRDQLTAAFESLPGYSSADWDAEFLAMHFGAQQVAVGSRTALKPHFQSIAGGTIMHYFQSVPSEVASRQTRLIAERGPHYVQLASAIAGGRDAAALRFRDLDPFQSIALFQVLMELVIMYGDMLKDWGYQ